MVAQCAQGSGNGDVDSGKGKGKSAGKKCGPEAREEIFNKAWEIGHVTGEDLWRKISRRSGIRNYTRTGQVGWVRVAFRVG